MINIVGLGNPGEEHSKQRHNVGWLVVDHLVTAFALPQAIVSSKFSGRVTEGVIADCPVTCLYPSTYMNNSGTAVRKLVPAGKEESVVLIYDDVDIPLGEFKLSVGRGDGGHNGVKSVIAALGTKEFIRIRIGIAGKSFFGVTKRPQGDKLSKHVLGNFTKREMQTVDEVAKQLEPVVETIVKEGIEKAMNKYN